MKSRNKKTHKIQTRIFPILLILLLLTACDTDGGETTGLGETSASKSLHLGNGTVEDENLYVHFLDVGQGDATLITCDGEAMLIDAGDNSKGTQIQSYLNTQGITELKYVIGTHPDADHIGGLDVILYKFDCDTIFMPPVANDSRTYEDVMSALREKNESVTEPLVGTEYTLGKASFKIVAPNGDYGDVTNDWSIGVLLQYGTTRFLMVGDAGEDAEHDMCQNGIDLSADVYKVAHHGSNTGSTEELLEKVKPTYAVISVGEDNSYGHPTAEVLNRLRASGIEVFRTDEQGTIVAESDGTQIIWNMSPSESWQAGEYRASSDDDQTTDNADGIKKELSRENTENSDIVYVTETGSKYHKSGCRYLEDSAIEISVTKAKAQGYTACKVCKP